MNEGEKRNYENKLPVLTISEICVSEEIQCRLAPIIIEYLDNKRSIIDAIEWILTVIVNDEKYGLEIYSHTRKDEEIEEVL